MSEPSVPTKSAFGSDSISEYRALEKRLLSAMAGGLDDATFGALALEIDAFQRRWNAPYQAFCAQRPTPKTWREIAPVPQAIFKRYTLSVAPESVTKVFRTSGTTGETRGEHHFLDTRLYDAAILCGWDALVQRTASAAILLAPRAVDAPHSSLSHMLGVLTHARIRWPAATVIAANGALDMESFRQAVTVNQPLALLGTALAFLHLFERLGSQSVVLPPGSFAMETGGYKGSGREIPKAELYAKFGAHLGLAPEDVINEYGMTELSSQCYAHGLGTAHIPAPSMRALVISPETGAEVAVGETGVLRLFDLANLGSVLCIETQDLAIRREHGFELLGRNPAALPRGCSRMADEQMRT